jgi:hypothetical protein
MFAPRLRQAIDVSMLHEVVDLDVSSSHCRSGVPPNVGGNRRAALTIANEEACAGTSG